MGGGSGIHYSKFSPLIISLKFWVIHYNKTNYSLKKRKVVKKSDYSLFINFFFNSLKKSRIIHYFRPSICTIHYFLAHYSIFIIKRPLFTNEYTPSRPSKKGNGQLSRQRCTQKTSKREQFAV